MTADEMVNLISTLGAGQDKPSPEDKKVFLSFLNLAYLELFTETFTNNYRIRLEEEELTITDGINANFAGRTILIYNVWLKSSNTPLEQGDLREILKRDPGLTEIGTPRFWFLFRNNLYTYPKQIGQLNIGIRHMSEPPDLELNTQEVDIPFPRMYHQGIVDGGCYYLYQDEGGFKDGVKMKESIERWKTCKSKIACYFANTNKQKSYSTFSKV